MDNPPEPMPKVSIDPQPPSPDSPKPPSSPSAEQIVVTSHEGSVVAVPAAEPTLEKAVTPPASDPKPQSPPPAPPVVIVAPESVPPTTSPVIPPPTSPVIPPPTSPVIPPAPIIQQVEAVPVKAPAVQTPPQPTMMVIETTKKESSTPEVPPAPTAVVVETVKETSAPPSPVAPPAVIVEPVRQTPSPPAPPVVVVASSSNTTPAPPIVPLLVTQKSPAPTIQRSDTATYEPSKKTDKVPVLVSTRSAPELAQPAANETHEIHAQPSQLSVQSAPPDMIVRRDTHVVILEQADGVQKPRHWRDRVRKFFVTKLGGSRILRLLLGKQASNITTAVVGRY